MTEAIGEFATIIFGRFLFGTIGAAVRFAWLRLIGRKVSFTKLWEDPKNSDEPYDKQAFKSRLLGFAFVLGLILLAVG
jgi:hypothetical protein